VPEQAVQVADAGLQRVQRELVRAAVGGVRRGAVALALAQVIGSGLGGGCAVDAACHGCWVGRARRCGRA